MRIARVSRGSTPAARLLLPALFGLAGFLIGSFNASPTAQVKAKGDAAALREQNRELSKELEQLKDRLAAAQAVVPAGAEASDPAQRPAEAGARSKYALEPFDLARFLGQDGLVQGFLFKPKTCLPAWSKGISDEGLLGRMADKMRAQMLSQLRPLSRNADASDAQFLGTRGIMKAMGISDVDDPLFASLNLRLSNIFASFMLNHDGSRHCACGQVAQRSGPVTSPDDVGTSGCQDGAAVPDDLCGCLPPLPREPPLSPILPWP